MASGHGNRANRPNTWLHRPMLHTFKKVLANSEPSTHGVKRTWWLHCEMSAYDPKRTSTALGDRRTKHSRSRSPRRRSSHASGSPTSHESAYGFAPSFLQFSECLLCRALHVAPGTFVGFPNPQQQRGTLVGVLLQCCHWLLVLRTSCGTSFTEAFLMFFDLCFPDIDLRLDLVCELLLHCHIRFSFADSLQCSDQ